MTVCRCYALASIMRKIFRFINFQFTRLESLSLFFLILGHAIASYTSYGFHHPDEHFQILEWSNYFVGLVPDPSRLAWEYAAHIRPWFQPLLHAVFCKTIFGLRGLQCL